MSGVEAAPPGVEQLGYLVFEVSDPAAWERFATEVLGLQVARRGPGGEVSLRMDGHAQRFFLLPGPADDLAAVGWQVRDERALEAVAARLGAAGVSVAEGVARARQVRRLVKLTDRAGVPTEIYCGPAMAEGPFQSEVVRAGFVADELGLGHVVLGARGLQEGQDFYRLLGFRLSDRITAEVYGYHADILFLHANARHHSLALGEQKGKRLHHFMIEAREIDEVGRAFDRCLRAGVKIFQTIGRHPNDRMLSFYALTPSGFQFEFGWGGRTVDDATWQPATYDHISEWGHHPMALFGGARGPRRSTDAGGAPC